MPARRKSASKTRKSAARKKTTARKPAAGKRAGSPLEAVAKKIVRATVDPSKFVVADLYVTDCESAEAGGDVARGHAGIEQKLRQWESMQKGTAWKARNVLLGRNLVVIEWDAKVTLNDGRVVALPEIAVHEIKGGKIARERFYYNPLLLAPPAS